MVMCPSVLLLAGISLLCDAAPSTLDKVTCAKELRNAGASDSFDAMVAHGIHSMTVDTLRMFDPTATEDNYVPTIDLDLRSEQAILPYAPIRKTNDSDSFLTEGMKILDSILMHMNEKHWDIAAFNPLERVVHAFHMREVWARTKVEYDKLGKTVPAPSAATCQCALDIDKNGIMKIMRFTAMALREPSLVYGDPNFNKRKQDDKNSVQGYYIQGGYQYNFFKHDEFKNSNDIPINTLLLQKLDRAMPPLKDPASWEYWKGKADTVVEHHRDLALFLHCAWAKGRADQKQV